MTHGNSITEIDDQDHDREYAGAAPTKTLLYHNYKRQQEHCGPIFNRLYQCSNK